MRRRGRDRYTPAKARAAGPDAKALAFLERDLNRALGLAMMSTSAFPWADEPPLIKGRVGLPAGYFPRQLIVSGA